jgi:hypothetical protein
MGQPFSGHDAGGQEYKSGIHRRKNMLAYYALKILYRRKI